jgi:hypothetical protein
MQKVSQAAYLDEFKIITEEMYETTKRKNSDYTGDDGDAFKNFTMVEAMGAGTTEMGFFTRMTDKMMRFAGFIRNGTLKVTDENIEDTILDLAVYCILFVCYRRTQKRAEAVNELNHRSGQGSSAPFQVETIDPNSSAG